ncbi:hypothetical protein VNO78_32218 [Psophocarpus tetragonolobus]|uniref:Uncharacterized protein n=1 Tax=Psophocarpus tetragonolobus TaxID=3891 RepID=A0AAN9NV86_PSOTE
MNSAVRRVVSACSVRWYGSGSGSRKPVDIPFQPKVANAVNLIGEVESPIQFQECTDGNVWAATVITRQDSPSSPYLSIPVIFHGDLAHSAKCYLKQHDFIHIAGQLTTDPPYFEHRHTNLQVMVQTLNFVKGYPHASSISATQDPWKDLLNHPNDWWDLRSSQANPKGPAFERKTNSQLLFINASTPIWVQQKLDSISFDFKPQPEPSISTSKTNPDSSFCSWTDLLDNPTQWSDFRDSKLNGLLNPKYPDFKRKDDNVSLWLNKAPTWVSSKLKGLDFDVPLIKSKKAKDGRGGDESWNDLVQNPAKWWDNRLDKRNEKSPDFKHKETGEGLWLNSSPSWVSSKLPPPKPKSVETGRKQTLVS